MVTSTLPETRLPPVPGPQFPQNGRQLRIIEMAESLAEIAARNAPEHDRDNTFPHDTFQALIDAGYHTLTIPEQMGGMGATALETMMAQERLARGDGSVALAICMHLGHIYGVATSEEWPEDLRQQVIAQVVNEGGLYNTAASEPGLGSPSRGGFFATTAERTDDGCWRLNGRKTWTTLAPALHWAGVGATITENGEPVEMVNFLVPMDADGVEIDETWDNMSMSATGSHDLVLTDVVVPDSHRLPVSGKPSNSPWSILTTPVYLGVGVAARDFTIAFAKTRKPAAMGGETIATLPNVQQRVADIELKLLAARSTLYGAVQQWEDHPEQRDELGWQLAGAKVLVTNNVIDITDQALRIVGAAGLQRKHPLERYFRDARAGLGNPPFDDVATGIIGKAILDQ
ncbi:MAG: acyl-CoA/acyl-ACP dehydrogenase [Chloroflexota bacterium]|nr:acyl-CoA/acyl-ACP dehydrogenase [Chloroflexota bacterium]